MAIRVGINGFGRIGRNTFRSIAKNHADDIEIVGINELAPVDTNAHLLKYDSNYGGFDGTVEAGDSALVVDGTAIRCFSEPDPGKIDWNGVGAEIVIESTGFFTDATQASGHLGGSVKKVIISAPASNEDVTVVLGVNEGDYDPAAHNVISNASCTTNCLGPIAKVLLDAFGIESGVMTTVHAYTGEQRLQDMGHKDIRRARAAATNIIPTSTGAAKAIALVIPALTGKLHGLAMRVPTATVSIVDLVVSTSMATSADEVNTALNRAADGPMKGILQVCDEELVSSDFKGSEFSSIVDSPSTMVMGGNLVKVMSWYDNEWGYSTRLGDLVQYVAAKGL
ncbi:type I glyceraldehyde-3-phosphate dehydrogenase [Candidatus Poribacteria bacterium]|jgi:glyceraldehyde 3-phosphate dehydrogenase|nr:type I glyceraldehyde-3-phosphate dehydrogenase [Candidatus Poribacteria bacterium]MBT5713105.1 type I glyceraldehyde-3-phosphate dehydrogenase [Candidatus Poribacteria bacterium]MBT7100725.1 type I glyceraldehyde-3-phosphate dehydrogenase [Candidatus Poribacteria bacterium]MBT7804719.1 type I glyceraldehyde-3-phosphate dehydrogenase [Candidatus Poribacteria bacterium]